MRGRLLLFAFAITQAVLYACMLPLWEGFDEPFHYAYVESLAVVHSIPVMGRSPISREIRTSLDLTPLSRLLCQAAPESTAFEDWLKLPEAERRAKRQALYAIPVAYRNQPDEILNYEAQQAPLAYLLYAPLDRLLAGMPLPRRILWLRLIGTAMAALLLWAGLERLATEVNLHSAFRAAAIAWVLSLQMLWAAIAHVGNDALAVPLTVWFLAALVSSARRRGSGRVIWLVTLTAAGLLTKAYFLAFVPVVVLFLAGQMLARHLDWKPIAWAAAILALLCGGWYTRSFILYRSFSGTQQSVAGIGLVEALKAVPQIHWLTSAGAFARWSLWTGNWSFTSFSRGTLDVELVLLAVAFILYLVRWRQIDPGELWLLTSAACFLCGLVYQTCVTWVHTHGQSTFPEPWYAQGVIACLVLLAFRGWQSAGLAGRWGGSIATAVATWIALLTYFAKLLPYYGGGVTRSTVPAVWHWWWSGGPSRLGTVTLAPAPVIYCFLALFAVLLAALAVRNVRALLTE